MLSILSTLAQYSSDFDYTYTTSTSPEASAAGAALGLGLILFMLLFAAVLYVFFSVCLMKIFKKAGREDAWAAWVPIYNTYVYYEIAGKPGWWVFLAFIPFVGGIISLITGIIASIELAKAFGKEAGYGILLALLPVIGYPMLAFGDATYKGAAQPEVPVDGVQPPVAPVA